MAPKLSQNSFGESFCVNPSSLKRESNQIISDAAFASTLYLASVNDLATAFFFLTLQKIIESKDAYVGTG